MQHTTLLPKLVRVISATVERLTALFKKELELSIDDEDYKRNEIRMNNLEKIRAGLKQIRQGLQGLGKEV